MRRRLVWGFPLLTAGLVAVLLPMSWATSSDDVVDTLFPMAFVAYAAIGSLIASRHPANPVGWLFAGLGLVSAFTETLYVYAASPGDSPPTGTVTAAAWLTTLLSGPSFVILVVLLLVFPDGTVLSRRWWGVGAAAGLLAALWSAALALGPGRLADVPTIRNPVGVERLDGIAGAARAGASTGLVLLFVAAAVSVVVRYRSSPAAARAQIKWLAAAGGFGISMVLAVVLLTLAVDTDKGFGSLLTGLLIWCALVAFPVSVAIAMLRHRLYDIDVVIKRALVYAPLTAALATAYLLLVLVLQTLLSPLAGESDLAVATSTLAVAALFRPLRARLQTAVDRRFYRGRYDAQRTLQEFSGKLRDELDLDSLAADLRGVVVQTMQPAHVTLWLRAETP